jgi:hypothetical protein
MAVLLAPDAMDAIPAIWLFVEVIMSVKQTMSAQETLFVTWEIIAGHPILALTVIPVTLLIRAAFLDVPLLLRVKTLIYNFISKEKVNYEKITCF